MKKFISLVISAALISGVCTVPAMAAEASFSDVASGSWYAEAVNYTTEKGMFSGTDASHFSPEGTMTRGMFVTVLGRMNNIPANNAVSQDAAADETALFSDVKADAYYAPYVAWASSNGIVSGMGNGIFAPDEKISREQMCTIFVRYLKDYKKQDLSSYMGESAVFADAKDISSWALDAVSIAQKMKLIEGSDVGGAVKFLPKDSVTRAAAATVFMRFDKMTTSPSKPEDPDTPVVPDPDDIQKPDVGSGGSGSGSGGSGGSGNGSGGSGTDKPSTPSYSEEEIAEEIQIAGYLKNMTERYENQAYIHSTDQIVKDAMNLLMSSLNDALKYRASGGFLSETYVRTTYAREISEFKRLYSQMTEDQDGQIKNVVIRLESEANIYTVLDYFGVASVNLN